MLIYDSAFSPFARKVRLVLDVKGLEADFVDGLNHDRQEELRAVNSRVEVPVLVDGETVVANSSDIVAYLEHKYPQRPVWPSDPGVRAQARKWERISDSLVDAILVDISYWMWAERDDERPVGMLEAAQHDLGTVYDQMESALAENQYLCGDLSIADIALFPHLAGAAALGVPFSEERHENVCSWMSRLRRRPEFLADLKRTKTFLQTVDTQNVERRKIFWRGDRIEWVLARGFEDWFFAEICADRVLWPPQEL